MSTRYLATTLAAVVACSACLPTFAQSGVTMWGVMDLGLARNLGNSGIAMQSGAADRFGFRGTEDLGGGTSSFFKLESAFNGQNGELKNQFWVRESIVGLEGTWGKLTLGREYTPTLVTMVNADPWWYDTVAGSGQQISLNYSDQWWINGSATYSKDLGPFNVAVQVAAKQGNLNPYVPEAGDAQRPPKGARVTYADGSAYVSVAWWDSGIGRSRITAATFKYDFRVAKPYLGFSYGRDLSTSDVLRNVIVGLVVPFQTSDVRVTFDRFDNLTAHATASQKLAVGYFYYLSKSTSLYTDVAYDSKASGGKTGFDVGLKTMF
ncbi:porin [Paraburkholderia sp. BL25I1N1]|uniref:porin n=1 Tax=Paraburkholderia sp. BL25I1N1 TaxID=1938804 RepID=UPI000D06FA20|nr:porin [Paraburkholderia sp. BL25I1N1]PRX92047.1 putative porin [Paraburkholderia sp. BL25I1N1]